MGPPVIEKEEESVMGLPLSSSLRHIEQGRRAPADHPGGEMVADGSSRPRAHPVVRTPKGGGSSPEDGVRALRAKRG
jgi:hypothetical protein